MDKLRGMEMRALKTVAEVIEKCGGLTAVARLTGRKDLRSAWNWKVNGRFPPNTFLVLTNALMERNYTAPPALWGIPSAAPSGNPRPVRNGKQPRRGRKRNGRRR